MDTHGLLIKDYLQLICEFLHTSIKLLAVIVMTVCLGQVRKFPIVNIPTHYKWNQILCHNIISSVNGSAVAPSHLGNHVHMQVNPEQSLSSSQFFHLTSGLL